MPLSWWRAECASRARPHREGLAEDGRPPRAARTASPALATAPARAPERRGWRTYVVTPDQTRPRAIPAGPASRPDDPTPTTPRLAAHPAHHERYPPAPGRPILVRVGAARRGRGASRPKPRSPDDPPWAAAWPRRRCRRRFGPPSRSSPIAP